MKLVSFKLDGIESWGAVVDGIVLDFSRVTGITTLAEFLGSESYEDRDNLVNQAFPIGEFGQLPLLPVIPRPEKIICTVRNYVEHHNEVVKVGLKFELTEKPPIFLRVWRSQTAHGAPIVKPRVSDTLDWEGELAVVIGKGGRDIPEDKAYEHIAGYACYNDASIREWQFHAKQIAAGKNFESTGGFGPWLVTADEIEPGKALKIETRLNGVTVQSSDTSYMIHSIPRLINYISTIFTLSPGDVIATGTPAGVGLSYEPPVYMKAGDVCEVEIEQIGTLHNVVVAQGAD